MTKQEYLDSLWENYAFYFDVLTPPDYSNCSTRYIAFESKYTISEAKLDSLTRVVFEKLADLELKVDKLLIDNKE